jgi:hypothetical protein
VSAAGCVLAVDVLLVVGAFVLTAAPVFVVLVGGGAQPASASARQTRGRDKIVREILSMSF